MTAILLTSEGMIADRYIDSQNVDNTGGFLRKKLFHNKKLSAFMATGVEKINPNEVEKLSEVGFEVFAAWMVDGVIPEVEWPKCGDFSLFIAQSPYQKDNHYQIKRKDGVLTAERLVYEHIYTYSGYNFELRVAYLLSSDIHTAFEIGTIDTRTVSAMYDFVDFKKAGKGIQHARRR